MKVTCPDCGKSFEVSTGGRPRLPISVTEVYNAIKTTETLTAAAKKLGCSRAYIFKVLKSNGENKKGR